MLTISVLLVGLTLATAVIAYWSDNLGKKLGKKRVSLWGMRPRTTATFLTIASSWLIMLFTLGAMLTVFSPLRQALLRFDEVQAQGDELEQRVGTLDTRLGELQGQKQQLQATVTNASRQLMGVRDQLTKARRAAQDARAKRDSAQKQAQRARAGAAQARARATQAAAREQQARANLTKVSAQRDATQRQRDAAQQQLGATQSELRDAQAQVKSADAKVAAANARVVKADALVATADAQYKEANAQLKQVVGDLLVARRAERTALQNAREAVTRATDAERRTETAGRLANNAGQAALKAEEQSIAAEVKVAAAEIRVAELEERAKALSANNRALAADNERIFQQASEIFLSDVRVPVGRTLVARTFEQKPSFLDARDELRALFNRAADKIVPGLLPGARLELLPLPNNGVAEELSADDIYSGLARLLARNPDALSVRLIAARNHRVGDKFLDASFVVVPIRPALSPDAELANAVLDGRDSDARLFSALLDLVDEGRSFAATQGVSPPLSPEAPDFYAPGSREQLFQTLRAISSINGPARVRILALQPISTADQLRVRFEIEALTATASATPTPAT